MGIIEILPVLIATGGSIYIAIIDIQEMRIPNRILLRLTLFTLATMFLASLIEGEIGRCEICWILGSDYVLVRFSFCITRACLRIYRFSSLCIDRDYFPNAESGSLNPVWTIHGLWTFDC
ncbi:MAG: hypothetical protein EBZ85_01975 [Actinobacteria bacterium]|nr:hypothetical protein [Actinomycetota bacterium]